MFRAIKFLLIVSCLVGVSLSVQIQIPPIAQLSDKSIRLNEIQQIQEPIINFERVYRRQVYEVSNDSIIPFAPCSQSPPQVTFNNVGYFRLPYANQQSIIYDYETLKNNQKNVLDMFNHDDMIYTMSSQGELRVYKLNSNSQTGIELTKSIQAIDLTVNKIEDDQTPQENQENQDQVQDPEANASEDKDEQQEPRVSQDPEQVKVANMNMGYFVSLKNVSLLLFCNDQHAVLFDLKTHQTTVLENYQAVDNFQTVISMGQDHFAVMDSQKGVFVYKVKQGLLPYQIELTNSLDRNKFGQSNQQYDGLALADMAFDQSRGILFCLDFSKGILTFDVSYEKENSQMIFTLSSFTILKKMCDLMHFSPQSKSIYLVCNKIHKINTEQWPKIQEKVFSHPLINVRQIFVEEKQNIFILAGYSVFKVMYLQRTTNYFQDDMLDRIIFKNGLAITANEQHIIALKYEIEKPAIICQTSNASLLGIHNLLLKTTAQCNSEYLNKVGYEASVKLTPKDTCVYSIFRNAYVWQKGEVPIKPLSILILVFMIFMVVMFIWFVLVKFRMKRANYELEALTSEGHKHLVEEDDGSDAYKGEAGHEKQNIQSGDAISKEAKQQQDPNKDLYSIE